MSTFFEQWWMICSIFIVALPVLGVALWGMWHNHQVDKYNEAHKHETV